MSKLEAAFCTIKDDGDVITLHNGWCCYRNNFIEQDTSLPLFKSYVLTIETWDKLIGMINGKVQS